MPCCYLPETFQKYCDGGSGEGELAENLVKAKSKSGAAKQKEMQSPLAEASAPKGNEALGSVGLPCIPIAWEAPTLRVAASE